MRERIVRVALAAVGAVLIAWALVPAARAVLLLRCPGGAPATPTEIGGQRVEPVRFRATDGVMLAGWFVADPVAQGTVVLVHGFKTSRVEMVDRAAFLRENHYAVLLYDSRGCGESAGIFGAGATEDRDIVGAARYVVSRGDAGAYRIGVLGVSLGAGDALLAGAEEIRINGVVADSTWQDERVQLERMATITVGAVVIPLLPYEPALVDALIGGRIEDARPADAMKAIGLQRVLLIHCREDDNATTPLAGAQAMLDSPGPAGQQKELFVFANCRHAGAFAVDPDRYKDVVLLFLAQALH